MTKIGTMMDGEHVALENYASQRIPKNSELAIALLRLDLEMP